MRLEDLKEKPELDTLGECYGYYPVRIIGLDINFYEDWVEGCPEMMNITIFQLAEFWDHIEGARV